MIALGVLIALWWSQRRWRARGGTADDISAIAIWAVPAGLIGSRLYHVATDWRSFQGNWQDTLAIWKGGLGIPGGLLVGVAVGVFVAHRRGLNVVEVLKAVIPTVPVAQAVGRWGNWFNQELFGRPSSLPWALEISPKNRPGDYVGYETFHPTFFYEGVWNLGLAVLLAKIMNLENFSNRSILGIWIFGYGVGRLWVEALRIDRASLVFGVRVNIWVSLLAVLLGVFLVVFRKQEITSHD